MILKQRSLDVDVMSFFIKTVGLSVSAAILLASDRASALTNHQPSINLHTQLPNNSTLAQNTEPQGDNTNEPRFTCEFLDGEYTVMYHPESQPGQTYAWATPSTMGGGWTQERRCNEISRRLEFYRPDGLLEMRTAVENNYDIICVTTQKNPACQIVLTVPPDQDPQATRDRVFENLTIADGGSSTDAVPTFIEEDTGSELVDQVLNEGLSALGIGKTPTRRSDRINLRPFLDRADGGTGTQLRQTIPARSNPRFNPDNFR